MEAVQLRFFANKHRVEIGLVAGRLLIRTGSGKVPAPAKAVIAELNDDLIDLLRDDPFSDEVCTREDEAAFAGWLQSCYPNGAPVCPTVLCNECGESRPGVTVTYHTGERAPMCCGCLLMERQFPTPVGARCGRCDVLLTSIRRFDSGGPLACADCWNDLRGGAK